GPHPGRDGVALHPFVVQEHPVTVHELRRDDRLARGTPQSRPEHHLAWGAVLPSVPRDESAPSLQLTLRGGAPGALLGGAPLCLQPPPLPRGTLAPPPALGALHAAEVARHGGPRQAPVEDLGRLHLEPRQTRLLQVAQLAVVDLVALVDLQPHDDPTGS